MEENYFVDHSIRSFKVFCIDNEGQKLGIMNTAEAIKKAEELGLNLVQVGFPPKGTFPTAKIMDYSKFKYEKSKNEKAAAKKQRESEIKTKEIKFKPTTDDNDLEIKAKHVKEFIADSCKVRVSITFKGREITHQEIAMQTYQRFFDMISDYAQVIGQPSMDGKIFSVLLEKKKGR